MGIQRLMIKISTYWREGSKEHIQKSKEHIQKSKQGNSNRQIMVSKCKC